MPSASPRNCSHPGCRALAYGGPRCPVHAQQQAQQRADRIGYTSGRWRRFRAAYLAEHPLCVVCGAPATVVDHLTPHREDEAAFWAGPFQSLCASDHSRKTARTNGGWGHT